MKSPIIDLRSDTVTKPTPEMMSVMASIDMSKLGDDVYGEDEYVNELQTYAATLFGMEAALFCPSGTMTNQIAIRIQAGFGEEVICDKLAHVYLYEGGGIASNAGASVRLLNGNLGQFTAQDVLQNINEVNDHFPTTKLVCAENTMNRGGGACWDFEELKRIAEVCKSHDLKFHLDGARLMNAIVAKSENPRAYGSIFNTISLCLSKGLGAPVGSLLLGSANDIALARRVRKSWGGGMRQAGILAVAGKYALENNLGQIQQDHSNAKVVASVLTNMSMVTSLIPVETNLILFSIDESYGADHFLNQLKTSGIKANKTGVNQIRFAFHLGVREEQLALIVKALNSMKG